MTREEPGAAGRPNASMLRDPGHFLALGGGAGLAPRAPGTFGTLAGIVVYLPLSQLPQTTYLGVVALLFLAGVPICRRTADALGTHDHGAIVFDEVVGYLLALSFCSVSILWAVAGFLAFRFFDIVKPWPVSVLDREVGGGFGIMLDDAAAAVYTIFFLELIEYFSESYTILQ